MGLVTPRCLLQRQIMEKDLVITVGRGVSTLALAAAAVAAPAAAAAGLLRVLAPAAAMDLMRMTGG